MNNKITIYELLGLVKDGQAPKRIEYDTEKYIWEAKLKEYRRYPYDNNLYYSLWSDYDLTKCLNDEIEILDNEDEEIKMPKKLEAILEFNKNGNHISKTPSNEELMFKINEIIDYLKSKGDE